jgi:hypothetical protein
MMTDFRCPRCGGSAFGTDYRTGQRKCHSDINATPLSRLTEEIAAGVRRDKPCGWKESPPYGGYKKGEPMTPEEQISNSVERLQQYAPCLDSEEARQLMAREIVYLLAAGLRFMPEEMGRALAERTAPKIA